ncbi:MAG: hypothetical protein ACRCV0_01320 [Brevinema sp.]
MISLQDSNFSVIRDFSTDQFQAHITLIEEIAFNNDFGKFGVNELLEAYLSLIKNIFETHLSTGKEEFRLLTEEAVLYDLAVEIVRLCYKYSYNTSSNDNDWENPF